jgi:hypothetical protein
MKLSEIGVPMITAGKTAAPLVRVGPRFGYARMSALL